MGTLRNAFALPKMRVKFKYGRKGTGGVPLHPNLNLENHKSSAWALVGTITLGLLHTPRVFILG